MGSKSKLMVRGATSAVLAAAALAMSANRAVAAYAYTITALAPPAQPSPLNTAINASGNVVISDDQPGTNPSLYTGGSSYKPLTSLDNDGDSLTSLNSTGLAVGTSATSGPSQAVYVNTVPSSPALVALNNGSGASSTASAVNATGAIAGSITISSTDTTKAVYWSSTSANPTPINFSSDWDTSAGTVSTANGINATGSIVGQAVSSSTENTDAFIDVGGTITDISPATSTYSNAEAINSGGSAVGQWIDGSGNVLAFIHTTSGGTVPLPTLGGSTDESDAESINTSGDAVGQADAADDSGEDAVLYDTSGGITDLNGSLEYDHTADPGWTLTNAESINDAGDIVGIGTLDGTAEAFLLTPSASVPEPASLGLALGAGALLLRRRRV